MTTAPLPRLYAGLAVWWPLFSRPEDYAEEGAWILSALGETLARKPDQILELGAGGGNIASHIIPHVPMTLTDLSGRMLEISRRLNPNTEHVEADMRSLRLGKTFDAVLIHDAIMYMTTARDLVAALATARAHLEPDGALVVLPDCVTETFEPRVQTGGHDTSDGVRGLRYIAWAHAPEVGATAHDLDFAIMLRVANGSVEVFHDRHKLGLFPRDAWREAFVSAGFLPPITRRDPWHRDVFIARPAPATARTSPAGKAG
jgi:trans-aconitate methyltransferase